MGALTMPSDPTFDAKSYVLTDDDVAALGKGAACPTYYVQLTDKLIALTKLEDEAPHLNGKAGFGMLSRAQQMQVLPLLPEDEQKNIKRHWELFDKFRYQDEYGKWHGVKLCDGGKEGVDEFAKLYRIEHPNRATRRRNGQRGKKSKGKGSGGEQRCTILMFSMRAPSLLTDPTKAYIGWTDDERAIADAALTPEVNGDWHALADIFFAKLGDSDDCEVADCYAIRHDRDMKPPIWDEAAGIYRFDIPKDWHLHFFIRFAGRDTGLTVANLASRLGIPPEQVEKNKVKGRYAWLTQCAYSIHALAPANKPEKFHYGPEAVYTLKGTPYHEVWAENRYQWELGRAGSVAAEASDEQMLAQLVDQILDGSVTRDMILLQDEYTRIWATVKGRTTIEAALLAYDEKRMAQASEALRQGRFYKSIIYIEGPAGSAKTEMGYGWCDFFRERYGWHVDYSAAKNALDDYHGAEVFFMDDVRAQAMTAEDWLKLLDAYHASPASARYRNKPSIAPRVVIITSTKSPVEFFYASAVRADAGATEAIDQFIRRILWRVRVFNPYEYGYYNVELSNGNARAEKPYDLYDVPTGRVDDAGYEKTVDLFNLGYLFAPLPAMFSPYGAGAAVIRDIDSRAGEHLTDGKLDELCHEAANCIFRRYLNLMRVGAIPPMPGPSDGFAQRLDGVTANAPTCYGLPGGPAIPVALPAASVTDGDDTDV